MSKTVPHRLVVPISIPINSMAESKYLAVQTNNLGQAGHVPPPLDDKISKAVYSKSQGSLLFQHGFDR